jgi:hypothetical protein
MTDLHVTLFHFTPLSIFHFPLLSHLSSPHFKSLHFTSLLITFLALFIKIRDLQEDVARASTGSWFQSPMVLYLCVYVLPMCACYHLCSQTMYFARKQIDETRGNRKGDYVIKMF